MKRHFNASIIVSGVMAFLVLTVAVSATRGADSRGEGSGPPPGLALPLFWQEDFESFDPSPYYMAGSATADSSSLRLTSNAEGQWGRIFYKRPAWMDEFIASFRLYLGWNTNGADGIAFLFCPQYEYTPGAGGSLDASCPDSLIVAYDTFGLVSDHVYVARGSTGNVLLGPAYVPELDNNDWHSSTVELNNGKITVVLDGATIFDEQLVPDHTPFAGYFGFTAATGGSYNQHNIDDVAISAWAPPTFLPALLKDHCNGYIGPYEQDSEEVNNDTPGEADGPLCFNKIYYGSPDDSLPEFESDYFYFYSTGGTFTVELLDFLVEGQLQLYYENTNNLVSYVGDQPTGDYILNYTGSAGKYLIRIYAMAGHNPGNGHYTLQLSK